MTPHPIQAQCPADLGPGLSDKTLATLQARAALAGYTLGTVTEPDGSLLYLVSRWDLSRTLPDLIAVAKFLGRVGAPE